MTEAEVGEGRCELSGEPVAIKVSYYLDDAATHALFVQVLSGSLYNADEARGCADAVDGEIMVVSPWQCAGAVRARVAVAGRRGGASAREASPSP